MKKIFLTLAMLIGMASMHAQNTVVESGQDFHLMYQSEAKAYGVQGALDFNNYLCFTGSMCSNLKFGSEDTNYLNMVFGVGLKQRIVFSDFFLFQAKLYPYLGYGSTYIPESDTYGHFYDHKEKNEFLYGAAVDAQIGFKLWDNSNGITFLSIGYQICAGKFKTDGMDENGNIMAGITIIM